MTLRSLYAPLSLVFGALLLAGCGPGFDSLGEGIRNPFGSICGLIWLVLNVLALIEIIGSSRPVGEKVVWGLVVWFFPFVGLLLYYFIGRKR